MICPSQLRRAACLLSLCLLTRCRLQVAAAPLPLGEEARRGEPLPKAPSLPAGGTRWQALAEEGSEAAGQNGEEAEELFQDVDPKALAAILLQALQPEPEKPGERHRANPEPDANEEEKVPSKSKSPEGPPLEAQRSRAAGQEERQAPPEASSSSEAAAGTSSRREEVADLKSALRELQSGSPALQGEEPAALALALAAAGDSGPAGGSPRDEVLRELDEYERLKVPSKRRAPPSEPWAGARKLRQQQHLEHQLLQRRYEELAESRRQAEEARRAAAEEERLADMASDLLLQYLLKDGDDDDDDGEEGEEGEEGEGGAGGQAQGRREGARAPGDSAEVSRKGSSLLFEDEEAGNVAEDKRSNEAAAAPEEEEEEEDIDPNTIDRLIELSSKLHLPADDVIDIINDVEKKKKEDLLPEEPRGGKSGKAKPRPAAHRGPAYRPPPPPLPKPYYYYHYYTPAYYKPSGRFLPKQEEASWNEVLKGDEFPPPKWSRAQPSPKLSNAISPWTVQSPAAAAAASSASASSRHYRRLPGPVVVPRDGYFGGGGGGGSSRGARDEELENYLESVLLKHPQMFP